MPLSCIAMSILIRVPELRWTLINDASNFNRPVRNPPGSKLLCRTRRKGANGNPGA